MLGLLPSPVALHDIHDVDAYVGGTIRRLRLVLDAGEREDLEAEGYAILWELAADWSGVGSFRGYVQTKLGFRLIDALHDLRGDVRPRAADGSRRWMPRPETSLDAELSRPGFSEVGLRRLTDFTRVPVAA